MLDKCLLVYFISTLVENVVSEISLDYYFGFEDSLRTTQHLDDCGSDKVIKHYCEEKCGRNHACLAGKCFCLLMKSQIKETVLETNVPKSKHDVAKQTSKGEKAASLIDSESEEGISQLMLLNDQTLHPVLRHHIAHFCPNLNIARECIKSCKNLNKPAFCGKDHVCYCGHKYDSQSDVKKHSRQGYGQLYNLYEQYFGLQEALKLNTVWTITTESYDSLQSSETNEYNESASNSENDENKSTGDNNSNNVDSIDANHSNVIEAAEAHKGNKNKSSHANKENENATVDSKYSNEAEATDEYDNNIAKSPDADGNVAESSEVNEDNGDATTYTDNDNEAKSNNTANESYSATD